MGNIIDGLKQVTVGQILRMFTGIGTTLTMLYLFAGPFVKSYAGEALLDVLIQQGVDPQAIAEMKKQGIANGINIGELAVDADKIRSDLSAVKQQNLLIINKVDNAAALLEKLLDQELRRTGSAGP